MPSVCGPGVNTYENQAVRRDRVLKSFCENTSPDISLERKALGQKGRFICLNLIRFETWR
jgi:hypothetical protein